MRTLKWFLEWRSLKIFSESTADLYTKLFKHAVEKTLIWYPGKIYNRYMTKFRKRLRETELINWSNAHLPFQMPEYPVKNKSVPVVSQLPVALGLVSAVQRCGCTEFSGKRRGHQFGLWQRRDNAPNTDYPYCRYRWRSASVSKLTSVDQATSPDIHHRVLYSIRP